MSTLCGGRLLATGESVEMSSSPGLQRRASGPSIWLRRYRCGRCSLTMLASDAAHVRECLRAVGKDGSA